MRPDRIAKAIAAGLSSAAGMFWTLNADKVMSGNDWATVVATLIIVGGLTWLVPNAPAVPTAQQLETARIEALKTSPDRVNAELTP